jgi:hypothetical protein
MKSTDIKVGKVYEILYRTSVDRVGNGWYSNKYVEKREPGVGTLIQMYVSTGPNHLFFVEGVGNVYATPNSILREVEPVTKAFADEDSIGEELTKLKKLGFSDEERAIEMSRAKTLLSDLGIDFRINDSNTSAVMDYESVMRLKLLALNLIKDQMLRD